MELEAYPVERFYDVDHPRDQFAQFPHERALTPLQDDSGLRSSGYQETSAAADAPR